MRYLYKINSAYDGFAPKKIPERLVDGRFLTLGWAKYLDELRVHDEVWIVFIGAGFQNGVYVQGLVATINAGKSEIRLRVRRSSTTTPLTDGPTSKALLGAVSVRYRQVFLWPAELREQCEAPDCAERKCLTCDVWNGVPQIDQAHITAPPGLRDVAVVPAYWIIPPRCFLYYNGRQPAPWVRRVTDMFRDFKVGEKRYAYPFAAGMTAALRARGEVDFDAIVPIPLSPEKAKAGELDRTGVLAAELGRLIDTRTRAYLSLSDPISKRRLLAQGYTATEFKTRYRQFLQIDRRIEDLHRIALVDDVITKGTTLSVVVAAIRGVNPNIEIVVVTAGQMIVKAAVADENGPAW